MPYFVRKTHKHASMKFMIDSARIRFQAIPRPVRTRLAAAFGWFVLLALPGLIRAQSLTSYVDPYIGSGGHGHVFVGASVPFGAVQPGPENFFKGWDYCSGYHYRDSVLIGFAQTHLSGTGIGDLGDVLVMPYTGPVKLHKGTEQDPGSGYASRYAHAEEQVRPGYYRVHLSDYDIDVELTASERVAFHRYHFPVSREAHIIIDLSEGLNDRATATYLRKVDDSTLEGYRFSKGWAKNQQLFFAIRSSVPLDHFRLFDGDQPATSTADSGQAVKGLISFARTPSIAELKIGISPVSPENALANIGAEIPGWNFDEVRRTADEKWNRALSKIAVKMPDEASARIFYTALFHTMIDPAIYNDHNGDYRGADKKVYRHAGFTNYSVFSFWDTYRAANPLFILTQPQRVPDMIHSMLAIYDQTGMLPIWHLMGNETGTMVGISSRQVIAEAYLKGIRGFNADHALTALENTSRNDTLGLQYVRRFQYIPVDRQSRAVAKGLEYAVGDQSIALMAEKMGKTDVSALFKKRAQEYHLYFDSAARFFRGRRADGGWVEPFNPLKGNNNIYAEGNAWQYLWLVPEDVHGLISLLGGERLFTARLDSFFVLTSTADERGLADLTGLIGQYAHGNEPSHHIAYLYAYAGQQWKTAEKARFIMDHFYTDKRDGIIGNEDCGQMSAWYIFSSLGFYPVFPADGKYVLGSPLVDSATIRLSGHRTFTVRTARSGPNDLYIQRVTLNGKAYTKSYIRYQDILKGGEMRFVMGSTPNYRFGAAIGDRP